MAKIKPSRGLIPGSTDLDDGFLEETKTHRHRMEINSQSSDRVYTVAQAKASGEWQCSCPGWKFKRAGRERSCKHLRAMMPLLKELDTKPLPGKKKPTKHKAKFKKVKKVKTLSATKKPKPVSIVATTREEILDLVDSLLDAIDKNEVSTVEVKVGYK